MSDPTGDAVPQPPSPAANAALAAGRYALGEEIARGGIGAVHRATDTALGREVAVKVLLDKHAPDSGTARRFAEEARIAGQLQHPNIPAVHDLGTLPDGRPFLAMKLIRGETLDELLKARPDPAADRGRFVAAFEQVCHALGYAHNHSVIHRDLKPANVMVGAFGEVQVMDWGLAKALGAGRPTDADDPDATAPTSVVMSPRDGEDQLTRAGSVLGTPAYMSPEQAIGAVDQIDARSDVFGLGGILAAILTGRPPFQGETAESTRQMAAQGKVAGCFGRLESSGADPELVALCKRCLAPEKAARPADAGAVAREVAALRQAAEERARQAELDRVRAEEQRKRRRVQLTLAGAVVGLVAAAGIGVALASLWQRAEGERETAEKARDGEMQARGEAEGARDQLAGEKKLTEEARDDALKLKGVAEKAQAAEEATRKKLEVVEYGRTMRVAYEEWHGNNISAARALLNGARSDLRGWEWHYVHRLCHSELITLRGNGQPVVFASLSPNGSRIVTVSGAWPQVRDARTGAELFELKGHTEIVSSASYSADGNRIVTAGHDKTARVWDATTGAVLLTLKGHADRLYAASFSTDGSRIVTASLDKTAKVWDGRTGAELLTLKHTSEVDWASVSGDGSRVVTGDRFRAIVWDAKTGAEVLTLNNRNGGLSRPSFSVDGTRIVTGGSDGTAKVWDARTGSELITLTGHTRPVMSAAFSTDGSRVVTASLDKSAKVWDARTGAELLTLKGHADFVYSASFSADGSRIVTAGGMDFTAKVWDANQPIESLSIEIGTVGGNSLSVQFSRNGTHIVQSAGRDNNGRDSNTRLRKTTMGIYERFRVEGTSASFNPNGTRIVTSGGPANSATVWDVKSGTQVLQLKAHTEPVVHASYSADGSRIVTSSLDRTARVWDATTGVAILTLKGHRHYVHSASFSPDGTRIATAGGTDGLAKVWDAKDGVELFNLKGHTINVLEGRSNAVTSVSFSTDSSRIVTGSEDMTARLWDARTGAELLTLKGHTNSVRTASFSADGSRIVTGSRDGTAKVWDAMTGAELLTLKGHAGEVVSASFSADGWRILTGSWDGTARIWDARPVNRDILPKDITLSNIPAELRSAIAAATRDSKWPEVVRLWDELIKLEPTVAGHYLSRADALARVGRHRDAGLDRVKALDLKDSISPAQRAATLPGFKLWKEASDAYAELAKTDTTPNAWLPVAILQLQAGDLAGYRKACAEAVGRLPKALGNPVNAVAWHCTLGPDAVTDWQPLLKALEELAQKDTANWAVRGTLGMLTYRKGDYAAALKHLTEAVRLRKQGATWDMAAFLAMTHHQLKQPKEAQDWWAKAAAMIDPALREPVEGQPAQPSPWNMRLAQQVLRREAEGLLGPVLKPKDAELDKLREAVRREPTSFEAHKNLYSHLMRTGDHTGALEAAQAGVRIAPENSLAHYYLRGALAKLGKHAEAAAAAWEAFRLNPKDSVIPYWLSVHLEAAGDLDGAIAAIRQALQLQQADQYKNRLAQLLKLKAERDARRELAPPPRELKR